MVSNKITTFNGKKYEFRTDGRIFRQLPNGDWTETGKAINDRGYLNVKIARKTYSVHRVIWEAFNGSIPDGLEIDHINRNRTDNRLENLRLVTHEQNQRNMSSNILAEELEAGMKHDSLDYKNALAKKHGYEDYSHYRRVLKARRKAKAKGEV